MAASLEKLFISQMSFDLEIHGKSLGSALTKSPSLTDIDIHKVDFDHPMGFFDLF